MTISVFRPSSPSSFDFLLLRGLPPYHYPGNQPLAGGEHVLRGPGLGTDLEEVQGASNRESTWLMLAIMLSEWHQNKAKHGFLLLLSSSNTQWKKPKVKQEFLWPLRKVPICKFFTSSFSPWRGLAYLRKVQLANIASAGRSDRHPCALMARDFHSCVCLLHGTESSDSSWEKDKITTSPPFRTLLRDSICFPSSLIFYFEGVTCRAGTPVTCRALPTYIPLLPPASLSTLLLWPQT